MNEAQGTAETESKEFRVRYPGWWFISWVAILLMWGYETVLSLGAFLDYFRLTGTAPGISLELGGWAIIHVLLFFFVIYALIHGLIEQKRSRVFVDDKNLTYINWRGREWVIPWEEIQQVRFYPRVLGTPAHLVIRTGDRKIGLPVYLEKGEELIDLLIDRCRLKTEREGWYSTRYTREGQGIETSNPH